MATQTVSQAAGIDCAAIAIYSTHERAEAAVKELAAARFDITKISVVGRGLHSEEDVTGFFSNGDRIRFWGSRGAFWGGLWGLLLGGLFVTMPFVGPVVVVGHLAAMIASGIEAAVIAGGAGAIGAALYGTGLPKDAVLRYEKSIKEDHFLVIVHGTTSDVERAKQILANGEAQTLDIHTGLNANDSVAADGPAD